MNTRPSATVLLILSALLIVLLCLSAAVCGALGALQLASTGSAEDITPLLLWVLGILWCALLLAPTLYYAIRSLQGRPDHPGPFASGWSAWLPYVLMVLVYPLVLLAGSQVSRSGQVAQWVLPFLQIPAATLPVFWLCGLALRRLAFGSGLQRWGIFGLGLTLGPGLILVVELGAVFVLLLAFSIRLASDQSQALELMILAQRLQYADPDPAVIWRILEPHLVQPTTLLGLFGFIAILVPLVEETLKPVGVWLLAGRDLNPAQGFAAGVLSGAGYALFENLFITAPGEQWALISIGRIGTTTMHILTAGLTGYALAGAWKRGSYFRLAVLFAAAVLIHALWNGLTMFSVAASLQLPESLPFSFAELSRVAAGILLGLYLLLFGGLILANLRLRRYAIIPALESPPSPEASEPGPAESEPGPGSLP